MNKPVLISDFNRAADLEGIVTQNILVRRGLGREPQQAEKHTRSATAVRVIFRVCGYTSIACTVTDLVVFANLVSLFDYLNDATLVVAVQRFLAFAP